MREKFELCAKVVGLVLLSLGILGVLIAVLLFLFYPHIMPSSHLLSGSINRQVQDDLDSEMWKVRIWTTVFLVLVGILEAAMGAYLMRSDNRIVRLCYPRKSGEMQPSMASGSLSIDRAPSNAPVEAQGARNRRETQYAPPGYFEQHD